VKILLCHNHYRHAGGEDASCAAEAVLLESHGHRVVRFTAHNDSIADARAWRLAGRAIWNRSAYAELRRLIRLERPDVLHCTNWFPLISASVYHAARAEGVPVVQALRNYRVGCPATLFFRNGHVCEDCRSKILAWPGVLRGCYRDSRAATALVAVTFGTHHALGTFRRDVSVYYTPTAFARDLLVRCRIPADRILVKPNFVHPDPGRREGGGGYAVYVGRLSPEKGLDTLLGAWARLEDATPLVIVGDGPEAPRVAEAARRDARIRWLGRRPLPEVADIVGEAACLVMPSLWYETFGRVIIEAFAVGTPSVVSRLGAMRELVEDGRTGLHVTPGDAADLAATIRRLLSSPTRLAGMRRAAREAYERKYTAERNYRMLMDIYGRAAGLPLRREAAS
jgi:glycosyltransferase involved in cell wall biosynthesis